MTDDEKTRLRDAAVRDLFQRGWSIDSLVGVFGLKQFAIEIILREGVRTY